MIDYFYDLRYRLSNINCKIEIISSNILEHKMNYTFSLFEFGISDETKYVYNKYKKFFIRWEEYTKKMHGFVDFVPYEEILNEHRVMCEIAENIEEDLIEDQDIVINDLKNWYPLFKFPNGDAFCYDKRNGKIVFFEHEVFDTGVNLNGLIIADSLDKLLESWSKVYFIDIYDWCEGVNEHGIDITKPIYKSILQISEGIF